MKRIATLLSIVTLACTIFAGASSALAQEDPLYFKVTITGKGYLVDDDNETESKAKFKVNGYLMWLGDDYVLACECEESKDGWYVTDGDVDPADTGDALYIANEEFDICIPDGYVLVLLSTRIPYKIKDEEVTKAMFTSLAGQIVDWDLDVDGAIVGSVSAKGKMTAFDKLPADVQAIFTGYLAP